MINLPTLWKKSPFTSLSKVNFRDFNSLQRQVDRIFDEFMTTGFFEREPIAPVEFVPACNVDETESHYVLSFDLPGVKKEEIKVELVDNALIVSGERKEEHETKSKNTYRSESSYGSFMRSFAMPAGLKAEQIESEYKDGVLRIAVPKTEASKGTPVKIGESKPGFWDKILSSKKEEEKKSPKAA